MTEGENRPLFHTFRPDREMLRVGTRLRTFTGTAVDTVLTRADRFRYIVYTNFVHVKYLYILAAALLAGVLLLRGPVHALVLLFCLGLCAGAACLFFFMMSLGYRETPFSCGLNAGGFFLRDDVSYLRLPWEALKVSRTRRRYYVYYTWYAGLTIPRDALSDEQERLLSAQRKKPRPSRKHG